MAKLTFSLDDATVRTLRKTAERLRKPQSLVVREAIAHYAVQEDKLTDDERDRMLRVIDKIRKLPPSRPRHEVEKELREIRRSRRAGWRPGAR
jgi:predicted transcriptional regulator